MTMELRIVGSRSLKAKRTVVRHLVERSRNLGLSVSEVDHHDQWQRAAIGFAAVGSTAGQVTDILDRAERFVWSHPEVEVLACVRDWLELDR